MEDKNREINLTPRQRFLGNLTAGIFVVLCGLFLLLCGFKVIPLAVRHVAAAAILFSIGAVLFINSLVQRNSVSLWIAFCFLVPALVSALAEADSVPAGYAQLYPLYVGTPAVASLFTMFMSREWAAHIKVFLIFGLAAGIFALQSSGTCSWGIVVPLIVILAGLVVVYFAIKNSKEDEKDEK